MKIQLVVASAAAILLVTACSSNPQLVKNDQLAMYEGNNKLCENHKSDFQHVRAAFDKEHAEVCSGSCTYTSSMNKNSDSMERIAGLYYLMNCDYSYGRL